MVFLSFLLSCITGCNGYIYVGDGWQNTPEEALSIARSSSTSNEYGIYSVKQMIDTYYISDMAIMYYVSQNETFVEASFVTNSSGQFHFHGYTEEYNLEEPVSFVLNGDPEQWIMYSYFQVNDEGTVFGWKYSTAPSVLVNNKETQSKEYNFECNGKSYCLDYWWCDNIQEEEITISYDTN